MRRVNSGYVIIDKQSLLNVDRRNAMNTFQLVCFLAVAENLSFARAAEQPHITQPAVTQQIRTLEKELGARLFIRTTRSVKLTEEGKSFFIDARQMVEISEHAKKRFENPFGTEIATLAIGCSNYPSMFLLSTALRRTAAGRPDFHPRLQLVSFLQIQRAIDDGGLDAVISFREAASMRISAAYEELAKVPLVCICHSGHPLALRCSVTKDELKNERLVLFTPSRTSPVVADVQSGLMGGRAPSEFYFCDSGEAIVALVCSGFGISVIPDLALPGGHPVAKVHIEDAAPLSFGIYHKPAQENKLLQTFLKTLKESFSLDA